MCISFRKGIIKLSAVLLIVICVIPFSASASSFVPYTTYTYSYDGDAQISPHAFIPKERLDGTSMGTGELSDPSDMYIDRNTKLIYIADTGNNRILVLDKNLNKLRELSGFNNNGNIDNFKTPQGVYVSDNGHIYVADTGNNRIAEFDADYNLVRTIGKPDSPFWPDDTSFKPIALVVDSGNRIYALSQNLNMGVVNLTETGEFLGFYGAQKVKKNILDWFRELFATKAQRARMVKTVPRVYNSIAIDNRDFIWLTANSIDKASLIDYMTSKSAVNAPIKRLNPNGDDVLFRNAKWAPGGDLGDAPSSIVDSACKPNGIYSILDSNRNKIFTYDNNGNLLYAFGGTGQQLGTFTLCGALSYLDNDLLVLDKGNGTVTRFVQSEYGALIEKAIIADENREYDDSLDCWSKVLKQNQNFDMAYTGIAEASMRSNKYSDAMGYFKTARDTENYSAAFQKYRSGFVRNYIIYILVIVAVILGIVWFVNKKIKKLNEKEHKTGSKPSLKESFFYAFYSIYHPIKGAWDLKMGPRGSLGGAVIINLLVVVTFIFKGIGTGYIFNNILIGNYNILLTIASVLVPIALWCVANWSLTTLTGGEANLKQIYTMTCYSLLPLVLINVPITVVSNFLVIEEQAFLTFMIFLSFAWSFLLIFAGVMTIHDYSFGKTVFTVFLSIVGMLIILFLAILLITLTNKIYMFLLQIYEEIVNRF